MFGLPGGAELLVLLAVVVLLFGPTLFVAWIAWTVARAGQGQGAGGQEEPPQSVTEATDPAVMVARERYARGEISKDELEEIRRTLGY